METTPLIPRQKIDPTPTPTYETLRDREIAISDDEYDETKTMDELLMNEDDEDDDTQNPKKKWTWRHSLCIWVIIIVAGLLCAVFLPPLFNTVDDTPSLFGGMYSVAHNQEYNVNNHYTSDITCPSGYYATAVGKFLACYQCGDVHLYLCLKEDTTEDARGFFGGMFNENKCGGKQYENPLTGDFTCTDGGYEPYLAIQATTQSLTNENTNCDTNVYVCLKPALDYYNLGGFYTTFTNKIESDECEEQALLTDDEKSSMCAESNVEHHLMHSLDCPHRYEQHLLSHVYSPGATRSCPGCNGRAYICLMEEREIDDKENDDMLGAQHP